MLGFAALFLDHALDWVGAVGWVSGAALLAIALPVGIVLADFGKGFCHWVGDTFFEEDTPILGTMWIRPFREHHRDPLAITRHSALEVSGNNCLLLIGILALARNLGPSFQTTLGALGGALLLISVLCVAVSNQLHRWAHAPRAPATVRRLQRRGWLLAPDAHAHHHRGRHNRAYCVTTGWCNPFLDRVALFARLEPHRVRRRTRNSPAAEARR